MWFLGSCLLLGQLFFVLVSHVEWFVIHLSILRNTQNPNDVLFYLVDYVLITPVFVPNWNCILVASNRNDDTIDLVLVSELLADDAHDQVFPKFVGYKWLTLIETNLPSATFRILLVLPRRLNALNKHIDLGTGLQFIWSLDVLVDAPKLLYCLETGNWLGFPIIRSPITRLNKDPKGILPL